jgi:hypothetical protein
MFSRYPNVLKETRNLRFGAIPVISENSLHKIDNLTD